MSELVVVGRVGRPHGLDGAFVVEQPSDDERRFAVGATLLVDAEPATVVLSRRIGGGRRAIKLDRKAERGRELAVRRTDLPEPEAGQFYVFQLVGLRVVDGEHVVGTVKDVLPGAANDNIELDTGALIPLIEDAVREIDLGEGRIVLNPGFIDPPIP